MEFTGNTISLSSFKAHAANIIKEIYGNRGTLIITQNGETKAIDQEIRSYEETQTSLAMLKIIAVGEKDIEEGRVQPAADVFRELYEKTGKENYK
ncbi:antitoxin, Phd family protein [Desulfoluna sp.]|uniref:antitoxin, Phd family protein n=1 Tax=Desulfoluna sp. TaxID=2045199 RepID=UPI00260EC147|nr:antitoxin, Phd family protein [Desulfoluna sp.]